MSCSHFAQNLNPPRSNQAIHKEQCTRCFVDQDYENGIYIFLDDFNSYCTEHAQRVLDSRESPLSLNIKRSLKDDVAPPPLKKLAIEASKEKDKFKFESSVYCWTCRRTLNTSETTQLSKITQAVLEADSSAHQAEVKAWEQEITGCEHSVSVSEMQIQNAPQITGKATCAACQLDHNLWLCLTCGHVACGRAQFGGTGGNGHALVHFESHQHPVAVKLGTITAEGHADVYCYACNEERIDPNLAQDLAHFGIKIHSLQKTEKSMTELQLEHNLQYDFESTNTDGEDMVPVSGPGLTGLTNLGNSCYMASVLQVLFSLPAFAEPYEKIYNRFVDSKDPARDLNIQLAKVQNGLCSGKFAKARQDEKYQEGIKPNMFKTLIGQSHAEFSSMRQQDAEEFLVYLLEKVRQDNKNDDPTEMFSFQLQDRLECTECHGVRYVTETQEVVSVPVQAMKSPEDASKFQAVSLDNCFNELTRTETIEYRCVKCKKQVQALKRQSFLTLPDVLFVHAQRFQHINWVPTKVDVPATFDLDGVLNMGPYLGEGIQPNETELVEDASEPSYNAETISNLESMGFSDIQAKNAINQVGDDATACLEWIFANLDQSLAPIQTTNSQSQSVNAESLAMLVSMGYPEDLSRRALQANQDNLENALNWILDPPTEVLVAPSSTQPYGSRTPSGYTLKGYISHRGPSTHSGHYVAHIRKSVDGVQKWILFNDARVLLVNDSSIQAAAEQAYVWVFERIK